MKNSKKLVVFILLFSIFVGNTQTVFATVDNDIIIDSNVQSKISELLIEYPQYEEYIEGVIDSVRSSDFTLNEEDVNKFIMDAVNQAKEMGKQNAIEYKAAMEEYEKNITSRGVITYAAALAAYNAGIALVNSKGCPHTANYMAHAIMPEDSTGYPAAIEDYNTSWAYELIYDCYEFQGMVTERFETVVLPNNPSGGTISGSFAYTKGNSSLDAFAALHNVKYMVTFTKRASGGYDATYSLSDVYDFAWSNQYSDFAVNFGNNYCVLMQQMNWIRPYDIFVTVT